MGEINVSPEAVTARQALATLTQMGTMVTRKALDIQVQEGNELIKMMESSGVGQNVNTQG